MTKKRTDLSTEETGVGDEKIKNTYYLSADTDHRLEMARVTLRHMSGKKLSKSDILEGALRLALDDLESQGKDCPLAILLL